MTADSVSDVASLATWLRRQDQDVAVVSSEGQMGAAEVLIAFLAGSAALKTFLTVAREWIRAHRSMIAVEVEGRGRFVVEGRTDIDQLVELLSSDAAPEETRA